jgi:5-methylcytosine-specific restriction endonuclease McrA
MKIVNRTERMSELRSKGYGYGKIGKLFGISRQRVHQILSGYKDPEAIRSGIYDNRDILLSRDNNQCQICHGSENLIIHHIDKDDHNNNWDNLIVLCNRCHLELHRPKRKSKT